MALPFLLVTICDGYGVFLENSMNENGGLFTEQ